MDPVAFEGWYAHHHGRLVSTLTVIAADPFVAAEVVDEAFTRAYERWDRVSGMASPVGWTYQTALNVLRRRRRRASVEARLHLRREAGAGLLSARASPPSDWSAEIWDALLRLPLRERTAIGLRYVADLTTDDIARAMRLAPGSVGSTLHAARRNLARMLDDSLDLGDVTMIPLEELNDA